MPLSQQRDIQAPRAVPWIVFTAALIVFGRIIPAFF